VVDDERPQVGVLLATHFFDLWEDPARRRPLEAMLVSAASDEGAADELRDFVCADVIARVAALVDHDDLEVRAALAGAQLIGAALVRYVYQIPPMSEAPLAHVVGSVGRAVQGYFGDA